MRDSGRSLQVVHYVQSPNSQKKFGRAMSNYDETYDETYEEIIETYDEIMMKLG